MKQVRCNVHLPFVKCLVELFVSISWLSTVIMIMFIVETNGWVLFYLILYPKETMMDIFFIQWYLSFEKHFLYPAIKMHISYSAIVWVYCATKRLKNRMICDKWYFCSVLWIYIDLFYMHIPKRIFFFSRQEDLFSGKKRKVFISRQDVLFHDKTRNKFH